jgi:hypothetical protein
MALPLPSDFKEFLRLLNSTGVEYLLIGGYAVSLHGYVRTTNDLDIWIKISPENAAKVEEALRGFGFGGAGVKRDLFLTPDNIIRMGVPPLRIELLTAISGVDFDSCYGEKQTMNLGDVTVPVISLSRLRQNKAASGRAKDLADLEGLPEC